MLSVSLLRCVVGFLDFFFFFFNDTATTEIYTLSLHDALPICVHGVGALADLGLRGHLELRPDRIFRARRDRKSTRLNSSHLGISYAVFCLKKKKKKVPDPRMTICRRGCSKSACSMDALRMPST